MDEPSNLADQILDQAADAVIFADRSGRIAAGTAPRRRCSGSAPRRRWGKVSI